ncbi:protein translocase subunit SecD [Patescibacteria group bacterium]|nr:protein translocase subunit SecD [Patescibacteria group bacterium]MBU4353195.1 protein translocase subunit SecD [Patescibacteria group bacterium]MBU4477091.1 protein translocase subunit SecD [Patescibacteria group bacterium]MCG2698980.1 protein translocase subunit SecD [Candidatus Parcubacteria bacterium]
MPKYRFIAVLIILAGAAIGYFDVAHIFSPNLFFSMPFKLGLDLRGGAHLVYRADVSQISPSEIQDAMDGLRDVIERRVNLFGVAEPLVQVEQKGILKASENKEQRLIVELPGVTDVNQAIKMLGETPFLEFRIEAPNMEEGVNAADAFLPSRLTGRYLEKATLEFSPTTYEPEISIQFNDEGAEIFAKLTKENVGKQLAIFLDGAPISAPVVREEIPNGRAQITGQFTPTEAKLLVQRLNSGALPVPIELISQQSVGPTLGEKVLMKGITAGIYGIILVSLFLVLWYRLPGLISVFALAIYIIIVLAIFKIIPVTLTAAGIAGFILSIGMAVDANILIFERMKEERRAGKQLNTAITEGFARAWLSIRDSNVSSLITAFILFWMGTSMVKGFALTLGIGVLVSMFSAIIISRTFLLAIGAKEESKLTQFLFGSHNSHKISQS